MMDLNNFLKLKKQISIRCSSDTAPFCFWSKELVEVVTMCREMKMVPRISKVEVDPNGGLRMVQAVMRVYVEEEERADE